MRYRKASLLQKIQKIAVGGLALGVAQSATASTFEARVEWTRDGIPHVTASDYAGLGYGYGYAVAKDQLCMLFDLVASLRGDRSRLFGPNERVGGYLLPTTNLNSDLFYRTRLTDAHVSKAMKGMSADARALAQGYAAGVNRYIKDTSPAALPEQCRSMQLPRITEADVVRISMQVAAIWASSSLVSSQAASDWNGNPLPLPDPKFAGQMTVAPLAERAEVGSNTWAFGSDVTGTGAGMIIGNPHTPWIGWLRMHVGHLVIPGKLDVMGADILGWPLIFSGFNNDVAWSMQAPSGVTFFALSKLDVTADSKAYRVDGKTVPFTFQDVPLEVRKDDGSIETRKYRFAHSSFGQVYRLEGRPGRPAGLYALADAGEANAGGIDQQLGMARARSVRELRDAVAANRGMTAYFVAADRHGETLMVQAGNLPAIDTAFLQRCGFEKAGGDMRPPVLDGSRSACSIRDPQGNVRLAPAKDLPAFVNRGVTTNSNDSYRLAVVGQDLKGYSPLLADPAANPDLRTRMSHRALDEVLADGVVSAEEGVDILFSDRSYASETSMDMIVRTCRDARASTPEARACTALQTWDRRFRPESRGALVFYQAWLRIAAIPDLYAAPFDPKTPLAVRALSDTPKVRAAILAVLATAQTEIEALGLNGAEEWGAILAAPTSKGRQRLRGASWEQGVLNVVNPEALGREGFVDVKSGASYIQVVRWQDGRRFVQTMLVHGQSADPKSVHYRDQFDQFRRGQLVTPPITAAEIAADPALTTLLLREDR